MSDGFQWFERVVDRNGVRVDMCLDNEGWVGLWTGSGVLHGKQILAMDYDQAVSLSAALALWAARKRKIDEEVRRGGDDVHDQ